MSPTILRKQGYRFFFFSREELRPHIHVLCSDGEAKFWLEPEMELARSHKLSKKRLGEIATIIEEHYDAFITAWRDYFGT